MNAVFLQEQKAYTFSKLLQILGVSEDKSFDILKSLSILSFVREVQTNSGINDLEDLIDEGFIEQLDLNDVDKIYIFKFVGIIIVSGICLIIYPKYIKSINEDIYQGFRKFKQIVSVIRKYQSKQQDFSFGQTNIDESSYNLLSVMLELIDDYHNYGLYTNDRTVITENGDGNILWDKTINETNAYIIEDIPVYLELFTEKTELNEQDFIRRLHALVISEGCKKISEVLKILDIEPVFLIDDTIEEIGDLDFILYKINQELNVQFVTRKQRVLHMIKNYIENRLSHSSDDTLSLVGTNSFNLVWEDVCADIKNNALDKSLNDLGLIPTDNVDKYTKLKEVIAKPIWKDKISGKEHKAKKTLIPDLIAIENIEKMKVFKIFDAKYYNIILNEKVIKKQPGVGDVTKQYLYQLAFANLLKKNGVNIVENAFLMPIDDTEEVVIGIASLEIFKMMVLDPPIADIDIVLLPCEKTFSKYLT